jgi:hypothetical protein
MVERKEQLTRAEKKKTFAEKYQIFNKGILAIAAVGILAGSSFAVAVFGGKAVEIPIVDNIKNWREKKKQKKNQENVRRRLR